MKAINSYYVIGLMSGTSLDGLDLAYCEFIWDKKWRFRLLKHQTKKYNTEWTIKLKTAHLLSGEKLIELDSEFGTYLGKACNAFIKKNNIKRLDLIASHGHTIFHQPEKKFTYQLGNGNAIYAQTSIPLVFDFRSLDVARGGEGAPLVPVGDQYLFPDYDICLNLGGIANLSMVKDKRRIAFDICFVNMGLNYLAGMMQKKYDAGGKMAASGEVDTGFLNQLNAQYAKWKRSRPSLGREGFEKFIQPILDDARFSVATKMRSFCESICVEIDRSIPAKAKQLNLLATGGGALNQFLIQLLQEKLKSKAVVVVPDRNVIEYKEAIVFGLLGVLRAQGKTNIFKSVTGATQDSSAGTSIGF